MQALLTEMFFIRLVGDWLTQSPLTNNTKAAFNFGKTNFSVL